MARQRRTLQGSDLAAGTKVVHPKYEGQTFKFSTPIRRFVGGAGQPQHVQILNLDGSLLHGGWFHLSSLRNQGWKLAPV